MEASTRKTAQKIVLDMGSTLLEAIAHLSDAALWSIALNIATTDKIALADALLAQLREETDALMRLKGRGHTLPALDSLPVPVV